MKPIDLTGKIFGMLKVISLNSERKNNQAVWSCLCDCGKKVSLRAYSIRTAGTTSCGCDSSRKRQETRKARGYTAHGLAKLTEYNNYNQMKQRCYNKLNPDYKNYGGRGIAVSSEWIDSFETFLKDMGLKPTPGHTIDRIDGEKGYSKDNCRWATRTEQSRNRSYVKLSLEKAEHIRMLYKSGEYSLRGLGRMFDVDPALIKKIVTYQLWKIKEE